MSPDRGELERWAMAEIASLAASEHRYADLVSAILDSVDRVLSGPFLAITVQETDGIGHYTRFGAGANRSWASEVARYTSETRRQRIGAPATQRAVPHHLAAPPAWLWSVRAETRTGRVAVLTIGALEPLAFTPDTEVTMQRLACHAVLVLDHAMLEQELEDLKPTDGLTGVANGRRLLEVLEYEIQRHRHSGRPLTVMLLDVEGLSGINRSYGRSYGNHILRKLAVLVEESVRPIDVVARCGLDEFAVVLPETDEEEALDLAERLQERVLTVEFAGGAVGLSIGIGHASPTESLTAEALMRRGEHALQEAKRQDRDRSALGVGSSRLRR